MLGSWIAIMNQNGHIGLINKMKDYFVTVVKLFVMAVDVALAVALVIMLGAYVLAMLGIILAIFAVAWVLDAKFTITEGGKQTGYYKRSTGFVSNKNYDK